MTEPKTYIVPDDGERIGVCADGILDVPARPIVPFIEGDGIGPDIWRAARTVLDAAVDRAYSGDRSVAWMQLYAGDEAYRRFGEWLPAETVEAIGLFTVAIKGPLTTPVGGGYRSLNVTLRQKLDLYACIRPVRHFTGVPSPVIHPERVNMIVFRENTEDVYAGIEWKENSPESMKLIHLLESEFGVNIPADSGIGIKPVSETRSRRLVRKAIRYALDNGRRSVTLVHKGNIMKYTEGAFRDWGYLEASENFGEKTVTESELVDKYNGQLPEGRILINDRIADAMFQQVLTRTAEYDVIATLNLNGDYLSDALAAQVGGLGLAPGANIGDTIGLFEATHGTAPKYAGQDKVNPGSLILSGGLMLRYLGWHESAELIEQAIETTIAGGTVTYDLARLMDGAREVKCSEFARAIVDNMT